MAAYVRALTAAETAALDPGVRLLVTLLRAWNFETVDSGDGRSKPGAGVEDARGVVEVAAAPHVVVQLEDAGEILERFDELNYLLEHAAGIRVDADAGPTAPILQGSIGFVRTPAPRVTAFLELWNVDDTHLPETLRAWLETTTPDDTGAVVPVVLAGSGDVAGPTVVRGRAFRATEFGAITFRAVGATLVEVQDAAGARVSVHALNDGERAIVRLHNEQILRVVAGSLVLEDGGIASV